MAAASPLPGAPRDPFPGAPRDPSRPLPGAPAALPGAFGVPGSVALGLVLALLSIAFGFGMGVVFGVAESDVKATLEESGTAALQSAYGGDLAAKDAVVKKSWDYLKRAHLHGGSIGASALGSILALVLLCRLGTLARLSALAFGAGALAYAVFWLLAGLRAPGLGGTGAAKESLAWLAYPSSTLCVLGLLGTLLCVTNDVLLRRRAG